MGLAKGKEQVQVDVTENFRGKIVLVCVQHLLPRGSGVDSVPLRLAVIFERIKVGI